MTVLEWIVALAFGVPIVVLCMLIVVFAMWMQTQEELREQTQP